MKKYVELNNRTFEVMPHLQVNKDCIESIYDVYKRPSKCKIEIWNKWLKWFNELKKITMTLFQFVRITLLVFPYMDE